MSIPPISPFSDSGGTHCLSHHFPSSSPLSPLPLTSPPPHFPPTYITSPISSTTTQRSHAPSTHPSLPFPPLYFTSFPSFPTHSHIPSALRNPPNSHPRPVTLVLPPLFLTSFPLLPLPLVILFLIPSLLPFYPLLTLTFPPFPLSSL